MSKRKQRVQSRSRGKRGQDFVVIRGDVNGAVYMSGPKAGGTVEAASAPKTAGLLVAQIGQIESLNGMQHAMCDAIDEVLKLLGVPFPAEPNVNTVIGSDEVPPGQLGRLQAAIASHAGASIRLRLVTERLQTLI
jgi:hypothetical protein